MNSFMQTFINGVVCCTIWLLVAAELVEGQWDCSGVKNKYMCGQDLLRRSGSVPQTDTKINDLGNALENLLKDKPYRDVLVTLLSSSRKEDSEILFDFEMLPSTSKDVDSSDEKHQRRMRKSKHHLHKLLSQLEERPS